MLSRDRTLIRIQAATGLLFALYLTLHLGNVLVASLGPAAFDVTLAQVRRIYQWPPLEVLLALLAPTVHLAVSLLRWRRRAVRAGDSRPPRAALRYRLHRWTGRVVALFLFGHILATRGPTWFLGIEVDSTLLHYTLKRWPWYFYPYYLLFAAAGLWHMGHGIIVALPALRVRLPRPLARLARPGSRPLPLFWGLGAIGLLLALLGLGGRLYPRQEQRFGDWDALYARLLGNEAAPVAPGDARPVPDEAP